MKTRHLLRLAWLELIRYKSISLFLVFNLALGLVGFFLLQIFQQSLALQSAEKAQVILGGDLSVSARRAFTPEERRAWESVIQFEESSQYYGMFSMIRAGSEARLASVGVFDSAYPLYGEFRLSGPAGFSNDRPRVWVDPEIQELLNLKDGDPVEIGESRFEYSGMITEDPTRLFRGTGFAPRVLIHRDYMAAAGLIKPGSTFTEYWSYRTLPGYDVVAAKMRLQKVITDPVVRIENSIDSADDSNRVLRYFTDYLGLVALVALGLCFLCGSYLLQWTFLSKKKSIAIYKTLGLTDERIVMIYLVQNFILSLAACLLGVAVVQAVQPLLQKIITEDFNLPIQLVFSAKAVVITCFIAIFGPILMVVPQILQIVELRPLMLFQNVDTGARRGIGYFAWIALSAFLFWLLSVWQSNSFQIASLFAGSLIGLILFFQLVNRLILYGLERLSPRFHWLPRYAIRGLTRKPASAGLVFTTMSLATLVLSLLPHVKTSIINEIKPENVSQIPSLFLFDIQPEQVAGLKALSKELLGQDLTMSPLVRSRILRINDQNYERTVPDGAIQTREADDEARFRNRGINLTYRDHLQASESVVKGEFQGVFPPPAAPGGTPGPGAAPEAAEPLPQISIEKRYADRVDIGLGDILTFDVQGVELRAQVSSLRQVRWTSFQPNFFILFPQGVLEDAPQIFLTSVASGRREVVKEFQRRVAGEFKNVSIIDVTATVQNSLKYIDQMAIGLQFMAWLAVLVGLFVFVVLLNTQIKERLQEMNLLQILGSTGRQVLRVVLIQFILLMTASVAFGVTLGLVMAWVLISFFFDLGTVYDGQYLTLLAAVLVPVCALALYVGLRPLKQMNPMDLIRQI